MRVHHRPALAAAADAASDAQCGYTLKIMLFRSNPSAVTFFASVKTINANIDKIGNTVLIVNNSIKWESSAR